MGKLHTQMQKNETASIFQFLDGALKYILLILFFPLEKKNSVGLI